MGRLRNLMIALVAGGVLAMAVIASAQITTGSVTGTVKDGQGAVIPGATVTLISETRGTQLPDVISSAEGDFQFVNVPADRYTIQKLNTRRFSCTGNTTVSPELWTQEKRVTGRSL